MDNKNKKTKSASATNTDATSKKENQLHLNENKNKRREKEKETKKSTTTARKIKPGASKTDTFEPSSYKPNSGNHKQDNKNKKPKNASATNTDDKSKKQKKLHLKENKNKKQEKEKNTKKSEKAANEIKARTSKTNTFEQNSRNHEKNKSTKDQEKKDMNEDEEYKYLMCALYALKFCTNKNVEKFEMSKKNEKYGDCNIELKVTFKNKDVVNFLFQFKHSKSENISLQMLTNKTIKQSGECENGEFYVKHFLDSTNKLENKGKNSKFFVFTNSEIDLQNNQKVTLTDENIELVAINSSEHLEFKELILNVDQNKKQNCCFQFSSNNLSSLKENIKLLLKNIVNCEIFSSFEKFMRNWWTDNYLLTKHDVISKLAELGLSSYILSIANTKCNEKTEILKEAIMKFKVTTVKSNTALTNIWNAESTQKTQENIPRIFEKNSKNLQEKTLWYNKKAPLVIEINSTNQTTIKKILQLENDNSGPILLVGSVTKNEIGHTDVFQSLSDLLDKYKKESFCSKLMKDFKISIQGKNPMTLKQLLHIDKDIGKVIKTEDLFEMTQTKHLVIGESNEEIPEMHIPRKLSMYSYSVDKVLEISKISVVLIIYKNAVRLKKHNIINLAKVSFDNIDQNAAKMFQASAFSFVDFQKLCNRFDNKNIYVFKETDKKDYVLVTKKEFVSNIKSFGNQESFKEDCIINELSNSINVICAPSGTGKTRLMQVLRNHCPADSRTVNINLTDYNKVLSEEPNYESIKDRFLNSNKSEKKILEKIKKVFVFLDGLDEINSKYAGLILDFAKRASSEGITVWLSSRETLKQKICETLHTVPLEVEQLDETQWKTHINQRLSPKYKPEEINKIIKVIEKTDAINRHLLGIPLRLQMITEMFLNNKQLLKKMEKENFVLTKLYKLFFDEKIKSQKKSEVGIFSLGLYELVALKTCLDEDDFKKFALNVAPDNKLLMRIKAEGDKYGIIKTVDDSGNAIFEHQTYAEYFACVFLKKNKNKIKLLKEELLTKYKNLLIFLDIMLAEAHPCHLSVIYRNQKQVDYGSHLKEKDEGGRSILHLVCQHDKIFADDVINKIRLGVSKKSIVSIFNAKLDQTKVLFNKRDKILGLNATEYAILSNNLTAVEHILRANLCEFNDIKDEIYKRYDVESLLLWAVLEGWYSLLDEMLKDGKILTRINGKPLIQIACTRQKNEKVIQLLVLCHHKLNSKDEDGNTALHTVCELGYLGNLKTLLECKSKNSIDLNAKNKIGQTPLHLACWNGHLNIVKLLLENGADANMLDNDNNNLLHFACRSKRQNLGIIEMLLKLNLDLNAKTKSGQTALHFVCLLGRFNIAKLLLENGADVNILDNDNKNLLHLVCGSEKGCLEIVQLLSNKLDLNAKTKTGLTALHFACLKGHVEIVKVLMKNGADGKNLLHFVCDSEEPKLEMVQLLLHAVNFNAKTKAGQTALQLACQKGHFDAVKYFIANNADTNILDDKNNNLLHFACKSKKQSLKLVQLLLNCKVNVNAKNKKDQSALFLSWNRQHFGTVKMLLKNGADPNSLDDERNTLLHYVCKFKKENLEIAQTLLNNEVDLDAKNTKGQTPLFLACNREHFNIVKLLLNNGANPNLDNNKNILHHVCKSEKQSVEIAKLLLEYGANINAKTTTGQTVLHFACFKGRIDIVKLLIEKGADTHLLDDDNKSVLHSACESWRPNLEMIHLLLNRGIDLNAKTVAGQTALHFAGIRGNPDIVNLLIRSGADADILDNEEKNLLHYACESWMQNLKMVRFLLSYGFSVNATTIKGQTALHLACLMGHFNIVKLLIEKGAETNSIDTDKENVLHYACKSWTQNVKIVEILLDQGVDINAKTVSGTTALHFACAKKHFDIVNLLIEKGIDVNILDNEHKNALHYICDLEEENVTTVQLLLNNRVDLNAKTAKGQVALHFACFKAHFNVVKLLLEQGVDPNIVDNDNKNALHFVCESWKENLEIVRLLCNNYRVDLNIETRKNETALVLALQQAHSQIVKHLQNKIAQ